MKALELKHFIRDTAGVRESMDQLAVQVTRKLDKASVLLVTGRRSGEGASFVAAQLARSLAELGREVVLVDADLRASRMDAAYRRGLNGEELPGLRSFLLRRSAWDECLYHTDVPRADVLPADGRSRHPLPLLTAPAFSELIFSLSGIYEYVIVDAPPVLESAETLALAPRADAALLVVGAGMGDAREIADAKEALEDADCPVLGVVLNRAETEKNNKKGR